MRLREGDTVQVISGKDKGKESRIIKVIPAKNRIIVENVNTADRPRLRQGRRQVPYLRQVWECTVTPRLKTKYAEEIAPALKDDLALENVMEVPRLTKIVVNVGMGEATLNRGIIDQVVDELSIITGQRPKVNHARKSIAGFKLREGQVVGASVTLRGDRMWEFYDRLVAVAIPRIRDFRGLNPKSFDGRGNYTFGVTEQLIFPEIDYDKISAVRGMDITICTSATDNEGGRRLLEMLGFPFRKQQVAG
jgi:large subunit ribosomal protein L5